MKEVFKRYLPFLEWGAVQQHNHHQSDDGFADSYHDAHSVVAGLFHADNNYIQ